MNEIKIGQLVVSSIFDEPQTSAADILSMLKDMAKGGRARI
jgi:hypothetical protein